MRVRVAQGKCPADTCPFLRDSWLLWLTRCYCALTQPSPTPPLPPVRVCWAFSRPDTTLCSVSAGSSLWFLGSHQSGPCEEQPLRPGSGSGTGTPGGGSASELHVACGVIVATRQGL